MVFLPFQNPTVPIDIRKPSSMVISLIVNLAFEDASAPLTGEISVVLVNEPLPVSSGSTESGDGFSGLTHKSILPLVFP